MKNRNCLNNNVLYLFITFVLFGCFAMDLCAQSKVQSIGNNSQSVQVDHRRRDDRRRPVVKNFPMSDEDFNFFMSRLQKESMKSSKISLVEVVCINNYFSCRQVLSIMKTFSFDDDKLSVVKIMKPSILDLENGEMLAENLTFDSYKKQVRALFAN